MRSAWPLGAAALVLTSQLLSIPYAHGATFPDVPDDYVHKASIDLLVEMNVVKGNPDGKFYPGRAVNRAELLTILYRALGITPDAGAKGCFPDVAAGSWYEMTVCDAAAHHYVDGYNDGNFRPEKEVNRVEALKMIINMYGMPVAELSDNNRGLVKFVDVSLSAWYTKYLVAAYTQGILPIAGQSGSRFYPDVALLRGEASAYVVNAIKRQSFQEQTSEYAASSGAQSSTEGNAAEAEGSHSSSVPLTIKQVDFPFSDDGAFDASRSVTYRFALAASAVADVKVSLDDPQGLTCRLFRLADQGLSLEYYLGVIQDDGCHIKAALSAGSYQLDIGGGVGATFDVFTKVGKSDGNDGFREAKILIKDTPRAAAMEVDNYIDCYKFSVTTETTMTLQLSTSAQGMKALIYAMEDVDLYGFTGPSANTSYLYPKGTYYACVQRGNQLLGKQQYTLTLK